MAEINFQCPECSKSLKSDDSLCGEPTTCSSCSAEIIIPIPGLKAGITLGDFEIIEQLGSGSMGEVWLAHQKTMDRKIALKILAPKFSSDSNFINRFLKEIKHSAKLSHPNIVTAFYAGTDKGHYYLAISYISGDTVDILQEKKGVYDEQEALKIALSIATALEYAWDEFKILHRDVKPANIIINKKGEAMLLDLGIAKSIDEESSLTMTGTVVGTPYYISPEQALGETDLDFRSDIYSLGTTLYHMLTGTVPFNATTAMAIIMKHLNDEFPPPRKHNPKISEGCEKLIRIMMSKDRNQRQLSWGELKKDINLVMEGKMPATFIPSDETNIAEKTEDKMKDHKQLDQSKKKHSSRKILIVSISLLSVLTLVVGLIALAGFGLYVSNVKNTSDTPQPNSNTTTVTPKAGNSITYNEFCDKVDLTKSTSLAVKDFWSKNKGKEFTWTGKVFNVVGGRRENDIYIDNPSRINYKGYNIILVTTDKEKAATLKKGQTISFTGNAYNYKAKSNSLVIVYLKNVKIQ
jgi:serine/threonine protein kinase